MNEVTSDKKVEMAATRINQLRARAALASDEDTRELLSKGIEELSQAFEELRVAQEELRVQNEALAAAEAVAEIERQRYQELFDLAPFGYLVTDQEGAIRQANRVAGHVLGSPPGYLVGKPLTVFIAPEDRPAFLALVSQLRRGEEATELTVRVLPQPEGTPSRVVELSVVKYSYPDTLTRGLRWQFRDVTDHWRAEQELRHLNAELEERIRTDHALRKADRVKDEFLATLAHELRNPLAPIRAAVQIMQMRGNLGAKDLHDLGVIDRQARRIGMLVNDLMDVSRIVQGKLRITPERVDLVEAARSAVEAGRHAVTGVELNLSASGEPVVVHADPARLDQILTNLLTNAVKFSHSGGRVAVAVTQADGVGEVHIRDSGVGIAPDVLPRVFDLFVQADADADRSRGGLGIGLHLVKQLVELHGGSVEARSDGPGHGSEFIVRLPRAKG